MALHGIASRVRWLLWGRRATARRVTGFKAAPRTFASSDAQFAEYSALWGAAEVFNSRLGRFSYTSGRVVNSVIGSFTSIGPETIVGGLGRHPTRWLSTHPAFYSTLGQTSLAFSDSDAFDEYAPVTIGNDVWIGARAVILDGVTIGDGAIIGACSLVTKDVRPYEIVAGTPARHVRMRFGDEQIRGLLEAKWWLRDLATLRRIAPLMRSEDPEPLLAALAHERNGA